MKNTIGEFTNFSDVLKYIINEDKYGETVLRNRERTENIINDLVPDSFQKEKKLLSDAYYCNVVRLILDANSMSEKHDIALNSAKAKLVKNAGISEESAIEILKDISSALGWKETVQCSRENSSLITDQINQKDDVELNASAESEIAFYGKVTPPKKKKKRFPIAILLLIAILVCVIWLMGRKQEDYSVVDVSKTELAEYDESKNISVVDENKTERTEYDESNNISQVIEVAEIESQSEIVEETEESDVVLEEEVIDDEVSSIETESTESQVEKYTISEIDSADWKELHEFITHSVYSPQDNLFYYLNAIDDEIYCYNLETGEKDVIISIPEIKDLCKENWPQSENSQMSLVSSESEDKYNIDVYGLVLNPYNNEIFVCGLFSDKEVKERRWWFYNIKDNSFSFEFDLNSEFRDIVRGDEYSRVVSAKNNRVFFVNENEYYYTYRSEGISFETDAHIYTMGNETADVDIGYWCEFDYLIDHNDVYYIIYCDRNRAYLYNLGTIYSQSPNITSSDSIEIFYNENAEVYECAGFCYYNNYLYIKDEFNDVYMTDIDNLTKDLYISNSDIKENGKMFLGDETCFGLHMTNDGGYITYDSSNKKIKYVKCNN